MTIIYILLGLIIWLLIKVILDTGTILNRLRDILDRMYFVHDWAEKEVKKNYEKEDHEKLITKLKAEGMFTDEK